MTLTDRLIGLAQQTREKFDRMTLRIDGVVASQNAVRLPTVGPTPPAAPQVNDLWVDTN